MTQAVRDLEDVPVVALSEGYWIDRGQFLAEVCARHGPIVRARHLKTDVVFLIGPSANRSLLATQRLSCSHAGGWGWVFGAGGGPPNLLTMDPPQHDLHRRILAPAFAAGRMERYLPLIAGVVEHRLLRWAARAQVDVYEEMRIIAFDLAARAFLGVRAGPEVALGRAVYLHGAGGRAGSFSALLHRAIAERRARAHDDALGLLAQACDERGLPLSDEQLLAHAEILLVAGYETTASLGAWALYLLARERDQAARLLEEQRRVAPDGRLSPAALQAMPLLDRALLEAERLYPPVPTAPRRLVRDAVFEGYALPAGTLVFYSPAGTHRMGDLWSDPSKFDPDRFAPPRAEHRRAPYGLVGFGGGPRTCIGISFARLALSVVLAQAVRRYDLAVAPEQMIAQRYGVTARPLRGIRLLVPPRVG